MSGIVMLVVFFVLMLGLSAIYSRGVRGKEGFLVANRELGLWQTAFSIAATWTWAPALFVSAQMAYDKGFSGLFWFLVPNVLCLIVFSEFAVRLRDRMPYGYTLPQYMGLRHSGRVQSLYLVQMIGLSTCAFAVQLLAGGMIFSMITGLPFLPVTLAMSAIALSYSLWAGIKSSVVTDHLQAIIIFVVGLIFIPWAVFEAGGPGLIIEGLGGVSGDYGNLFGAGGLEVFLSFGLATTIGLMSGPFGDQSFWQRAHAAKRSVVRRSFVIGAFIFGAIPLLMSLLGFLGAGMQMPTDDSQMINLDVVRQVLPAWTVIPFAFMLMSGLISTLDSCLCAVSSMAGADFERWGTVGFARFGMVLVALAAVAIANVPGMEIIYLFLFYGTLRASTLLPTVITLLQDGHIPEAAVFYGIIGSIAVGLPIFAYGNFGDHTLWIVVGSLLTVLISGTVIMVAGKIVRGRIERGAYAVADS
mgnify:CR=1 FL=1